MDVQNSKVHQNAKLPWEPPTNSRKADTGAFANLLAEERPPKEAPATKNTAPRKPDPSRAAEDPNIAPRVEKDSKRSAPKKSIEERPPVEKNSDERPTSNRVSGKKSQETKADVQKPEARDSQPKTAQPQKQAPAPKAETQDLRGQTKPQSNAPEVSNEKPVTQSGATATVPEAQEKATEEENIQTLLPQGAANPWLPFVPTPVFAPLPAVDPSSRQTEGLGAAFPLQSPISPAAQPQMSPLTSTLAVPQMSVMPTAVPTGLEQPQEFANLDKRLLGSGKMLQVTETPEMLFNQLLAQETPFTALPQEFNHAAIQTPSMQTEPIFKSLAEVTPSAVPAAPTLPLVSPFAQPLTQAAQESTPILQKGLEIQTFTQQSMQVSPLDNKALEGFATAKLLMNHESNAQPLAATPSLPSPMQSPSQNTLQNTIQSNLQFPMNPAQIPTQNPGQGAQAGASPLIAPQLPLHAQATEGLGPKEAAMQTPMVDTMRQQTEKTSDVQGKPSENPSTTGETLVKTPQRIEAPEKREATQDNSQNQGGNTPMEAKTSDKNTATSGKNTPEVARSSMQRVEESALRLKAQGGGSSKIQINDSQMGKISLQIHLAFGDKVFVEVKSADPKVRKAIEDRIDDLRSSLGTHNLALSEVKVVPEAQQAKGEMDFRQGQSFAQTAQDQNFNGSSGQQQQESTFGASNPHSHSSSPKATARRHSAETNVRRSANGSLNVSA